MRLSRSRLRWCTMAAAVVMLGSTPAQRANAQRHASVVPGFRFGPPLRAGLALGVVYGDHTAAAQFAGPIVLGEVGIGGGRVSAGVLFAAPFVSGVEFLGSAIRTWGSPAQLEANRTLAGGELRVFVFAVNIGVGVYRPVAGFDDDDRRTRYFLNVGLGI